MNLRYEKDKKILDIACQNFLLSGKLPNFEEVSNWYKAERNAEKFNKIPAFIKNFLANRSFAMAELLQNNEGDAYATGISTVLS
jgi:hypothetical protein